jgi:hypothetical protein
MKVCVGAVPNFDRSGSFRAMFRSQVRDDPSPRCHFSDPVSVAGILRKMSVVQFHGISVGMECFGEQSTAGVPVDEEN